jgi:hypothetical protein
MTFSKHFKYVISAIAVLALVLLGIGMRLEHSIEGHFAALRPHSPSSVLRSQDKEAILYNSISHILTVTTAKGTTKSYTRSPSVRVLKDGTVQVSKKEIGFEYSPFLGLGYSLSGLTVTPGAYLGLNIVDVWRFDAGGAIFVAKTGIRPLAEGSINVVSNTSVMVGYWPGAYYAAFVLKF